MQSEREREKGKFPREGKDGNLSNVPSQTSTAVFLQLIANTIPWLGGI